MYMSCPAKCIFLSGNVRESFRLGLLLFVVVFYLNSQYQTGNKPNYMEANKRMLRIRHWGGYYFKWKY